MRALLLPVLVLVVLAMKYVEKPKKMFVSTESKLPEGVEGNSFCTYLQNAVNRFSFENCFMDEGVGGFGVRTVLSSETFPEETVQPPDNWLWSRHPYIWEDGEEWVDLHGW